MRKFLMSLTVLAGATAAAASVAHAAPASVALPVYTGAAPQVEAVQYYSDWRYREWRRHEAYERWRRHEEWRRWHHYRNG